VCRTEPQPGTLHYESQFSHMPLADYRDRLARLSVLRKPNCAGKTLLRLTLSEGLSPERTNKVALRSELGKEVSAMTAFPEKMLCLHRYQLGLRCYPQTIVVDSSRVATGNRSQSQCKRSLADG